MSFLLGCAWLAVNVWVSEHSTLLMIAAVTVVQPRRARPLHRATDRAARLAA